MLQNNFAPLRDISMQNNMENFESIPQMPVFPSTSTISQKSSLSGIKLDIVKLSDDPNFKNSTVVSSSVSKTPGSEIDNLKMGQNTNISNDSTSGVSEQNQNKVSSSIASSESSKQDKSSNVQSSVTREQSQPNSSTVDIVPTKFDTSSITQKLDNAQQSITSYLYYFIGIILLIVIGIAIFMVMNKKPKVDVVELPSALETSSTV